MLAADLSRLRSGLLLPQDCDHLLFAEPRPLRPSGPLAEPDSDFFRKEIQGPRHPGTKLSSVMRSASCAGQQRRPARPVITSTRWRVSSGTSMSSRTGWSLSCSRRAVGSKRGAFQTSQGEVRHVYATRSHVQTVRKILVSEGASSHVRWKRGAVRGEDRVRKYAEDRTLFCGIPVTLIVPRANTARSPRRSRDRRPGDRPGGRVMWRR